MSDNTRVEWCDATWNPVAGCSKISPGCANCYAQRMARRMARMPQCDVAYTKVAAWDGKVELVRSALEKPLHWRKPRRIFVCSMGDLFHNEVKFGWIESLWAIMRARRRHTFLVLTKRPVRMLEMFQRLPLPTLPNVWLGVTAEDQQRADERIPILLRTPAAVRFVSCEPMLGPIQLHEDWIYCHRCREDGRWGKGAIDDPLSACAGGRPWHECCGDRLDWVICGGETGPGARPMDEDWARSLLCDCIWNDIPFFFKKVGPKQATPSDLMVREFPRERQ